MISSMGGKWFLKFAPGHEVILGRQDPLLLLLLIENIVIFLNLLKFIKALQDLYFSKEQ